MKIRSILLMGVLILLCSALAAGSASGSAQEPAVLASAGLPGAITYQGRLQDDGGPVTGECDFRFGLFASAEDSDQVGATLERLAVALEDGYFSVPDLDFGPGAFTGEARWLAVSVRCPAGGGSYAPLSPRQLLTAAPAAHSLALPFTAEANLGGPLAWFENDGTGEAAGFSSAQGFALWVDHAGLDGVYVYSAAQNGLRVVSAGAQGLQIDAAGGDGVFVQQAGSPSATGSSDQKNGFEVAGAEGYGLYVGRVDEDGVYVEKAADDGVTIFSAGNPTGNWISTWKNGVEVGGAEGYGIFVGRTGSNGVHVVEADPTGTGADGFHVRTAGSPSSWVDSNNSNGFEVEGAQGHGFYVGRADLAGVVVNSAQLDGLTVLSASDDGVDVEQAGSHGVVVVRAGNPSSVSYSPTSHNGFYVAGSQGYGLYVGRSDLDGVFVNSTAWHGVNVAGASVDGLYVRGAGDDGLDVAGSAYAGNFQGNINVTGDCYGCTIAIYGLNAGDQDLEPGQVVAIQDIQVETLDNAPALWRVIPAGEGLSAVGVVRGRAELEQAPEGETLREGETGRRLVPQDGPARPGEYLSIVIYGPMQVLAEPANDAIQPGTRLAVGASGAVRALKTVDVQGVSVAESAPLLGAALSAPDEQGLVWVLVNPQ